MLDIKYCTNKECTEKCAYKLTPEVESIARQHGKLLSLCERRCKIEKENRRNTLFKTIPPAKRAVYKGNDFSTSFPQNY